MKIKTADLTREQLNWAAAKAEGFTEFEPTRHRYADDWAQGGPIIDRMGIDVGSDRELLFPQRPDGQKVFIARLENACKHPTRNAFWYAPQSGPTRLAAAVRCFVASKLGDEVDVPEELCN